MIYIIEGPDGTGKTTLAQELARQTGYDIVHFSYPKTEEEKQDMFRMYANTMQAKRNLIIDRAWYSELVYGPVMRGGSSLDIYQCYDLEKIAGQRGAILIYCPGNAKGSYQRAKRRGEDYITKYEQHEKICEGYEKLMSLPHSIPMLIHQIPCN